MTALPPIDDRLRALEAELAALREEQVVLAAGLSHDLRAPLRAIDSFAYLVEQRAGAALDDTARDHLRRVREAGAHIGRLASRVQVYLNAANVPLQRTPVDLTLLADWCIAELRDAAPDGDGAADDIAIAPGLHAFADERLLRTALQEVLHNAWTFAHPATPRIIRIDGERVADATQLRIRDEGQGFDPLHAGKLGQPFQRLHAGDHPHGTGLGLAIARRIVERHGGRFSIEGRAGQGTLVQLWLPDAPEITA